MTRAGKVTKEMIGEWKEIYNNLEGTRKSTRFVYRTISKQYGVSVFTVYYHLNPDFKKKYLHHKRERYQKQKLKREKKKNYQKWYRRLQRTPDVYLSEIFTSGREFSIDEILDNIRKQTNVKFKKDTIRKFLKKYVDKEDPEIPIIESAKDSYRVAIPFD